MKKLIFLLIIFLSFNCFSQSGKGQHGSKVFSSFGSFTNSSNEAVGYFNIGRSEKKEDKTFDYFITFRDHNFESVAETKVTFGKQTLFLGSAYNGDNLALCFYDMQVGKYLVKIFDRAANLYIDEAIAYKSKKEIRKTKTKIYEKSFVNSIDFVAVKDQGFLLTYPGDYGVVSGDGFNTKVVLIKTDENVTTRIIPIPLKRDYFDRGTILRAEILDSNKDYIAIKKLNNHYSINIFDAKTGKVKYATEKGKSLDSIYINKAFFNTSGNLVTVGDYYKNYKEKKGNKTLGFYYQEITPSGEVVKLYKNTWDRVLSDFPKVVANSKLKEDGHLYLHNVIVHDTGFLALFESFELTLSAGKMLLSNSYENKQLTTNDAFIINFDKEFNVVSSKRIEKQISRWQGASSNYTARFNAERAARFGGFDFLYYQKDVNRNRYYFYFYDYERKKKEKNGYAIKTTIFENGKFYEDKLNIDSKASDHKVLPAEIGEILILEYFKTSGKFNIKKERFSLD